MSRTVNYSDFANFMKEKHIKVVKERVHDGASGWDGEKLYLKDSKGFLNSDGKYTNRPTSTTLDLSINGFCFTDDRMFDAFEDIKRFYSMRDMNSFEGFEMFIGTIEE